jgi:hypothetical protein
VPTEITAIVPKAPPGGELTCRALDHQFDDEGVTRERGVISYYATHALPHAGTVASWVGLIATAANDDLRRGRITTFHLPSLQIVGDAHVAIPGVSLTSGGAPPSSWFVLSREDGCVSLDVLASGDRLPRAPVSPDDYAAMMRDRGHHVTVGPPPGFPPELAGKVVMVKVRDDRAPVFARADVCPAR